MEELRVRMFGRFSIQVQGRRIDDLENRSQKPWLMLAYLLYHHGRTVTKEELLRLCWDSEEIKGDPANALRVVLHRTRVMLDRLGFLPGRELILRSRDGFTWNDRVPVYIDVEEFERLYRMGKATGDLKERQVCFEHAVGLYDGQFLIRNTSEKWVQCMAEQFRAMYLEMAAELLEILNTTGQTRRMEELCRSVLALEPYREEFHRRLMQVLLDEGRGREAAEVYEELRKKLLAEFDRLPEEQTGRLYFKILRAVRACSVPVELKQPELEATNDGQGAKLCDFAFYRMFYSSAEWLIVQCGLNVYHVHFVMEVRPDRNISDRLWERMMDGLTQQLRLGWSRGDALTRCAEGQILGMVQADGYEAACANCERQVEAFYRKYPNAPVSLHYGVWRVGEEKRR